MNIETKFKLGDKVKFTKEGGRSFIGVVSSISIWINNDGVDISYIIHDKDGNSTRYREETLEKQ